MKNSEIHIGLPKNIIRDFLAYSLIDALAYENVKIQIKWDEKKYNIYDWRIKCDEANIEYYQRSIAVYQKLRAVMELIKSNGWEEWDVSDEIEKDIPGKLYMSFIGTRMEYKNLLKEIKAHGENGR